MVGELSNLPSRWIFRILELNQRVEQAELLLEQKRQRAEQLAEILCNLWN
ncbi:hypothetical protein [Nostoc sp.]